MAAKTWSVGRSILFLSVAVGAAILVDQMVGCMSAAAQVRGRVADAAGAGGPLTTDSLIRQMAGSAGVIFVGAVSAVRHPVGIAGSPADAASGAVEVDFRVDQAVKGTRAGAVYTLREWAGLWVGGAERYRVGERRLMLLHSPNLSGFASPVHGSEGAIPLRGGGLAPGPDSASIAASEWMVDVRWLEAQTMRSPNRLAIPTGGRPLRPVGNLPVSEGLNPLLVRAQPGPWLDLTGASEAAEQTESVEGLAHVLALCADPAEMDDARR